MRYFIYKFYAVLGYLISMASLTYYVGWLSDLFVPFTIDTPALIDISRGNVILSVIINVLLMGLFALQHSIMARPAFKKKMSDILPQQMERATYVFVSGLFLSLVMLFWQPIEGVVWSISNAVLVYALYLSLFIGVLILVGATFCIDHFELFGLRQGFSKQGRVIVEPPFMQRGFYALVRHPIMTGLFIVFWATPYMSYGHFLYSFVSTLYIVYVIYKLEEKDLLAKIGPQYEEYQQNVPAFFPKLGK